MSFYQGKTVLVTGVAGFIGSNLTDILLQQGATVIGIDSFLTGRRVNIQHHTHNPAFHFIEADVIEDPQSYLSSISSISSSIQYAFHLASPASPVGYQKYPVQTYMANAFATHQLLQYFLRVNPKIRFLFSSTSEAYGDPLEHPQKETYWGNVNPNGPRSMYDESKRLGETICGVHHTQFSIDTRIVRIFNTYGPRMDLHDERVLPNYFLSTLSNKPILIHGGGNQTRSFCFISDLTAGLLQFMEKDGLDGETINLGNPQEITMNKLAQTVQEITHTIYKPEHVAARAEDPQRRMPDIQKAKNVLNWVPLVSLEEGLSRTYAYFQTQDL